MIVNLIAHADLVGELACLFHRPLIFVVTFALVSAIEYISGVVTPQLRTDPVQRASTVVVTGRTIPGGREPGEQRQGEGCGERELHRDC